MPVVTNKNAAFRRPLTAAIAALALLGSPVLAQDDVPEQAEPVSAQEESAETQEGVFGSSETQSILPSDISADQFIQFFTLFSANQEMSQAIDPLIAEMMAEGPMVENWEQSGIDILAELGTKPGGLSESLLLDESDGVIAVIDFSGMVSPSLEGFRSYALRPEIAGQSAERVFTQFAPGIWFETAHQREVHGNALCYSGYVGVTLHSKVPHTEWSEDDLLSTAFIFAMVDRLASLNFCAVYDKEESGNYPSKFFTFNGASLPELDEMNSVTTLLPLSELDIILQGE